MSPDEQAVVDALVAVVRDEQLTDEERLEAARRAREVATATDADLPVGVLLAAVADTLEWSECGDR